MSAPIRRIAIAAALALAAGAAQAQSTGQLMFTAFNADEDGWAMVALADIAAGTTVFFTDNEYVSGAFNTGESYHRWSTGAAPIAAGTVIRFSAIDVTSLAASVGTLARESVGGSSNYGVAASNETVYAYLGTSATAPTTFLGAISNDGFTAGGLAGTGLVAGVNATSLPISADWGQYAGPRSGLATFDAYRPLIANAGQWVGHDGVLAGDFGGEIPNTTAFTVQPIPEPADYAFMLAGLGLAGLIARRRAARVR